MSIQWHMLILRSWCNLLFPQVSVSGSRVTNFTALRNTPISTLACAWPMLYIVTRHLFINYICQILAIKGCKNIGSLSSELMKTLNIKMSYQHRDSNYKDKTVSRRSHPYNGNPISKKKYFILRWEPERLPTLLCVVVVRCRSIHLHRTCKNYPILPSASEGYLQDMGTFIAWIPR